MPRMSPHGWRGINFRCAITEAVSSLAKAFETTLDGVTRFPVRGKSRTVHA